MSRAIALWALLSACSSNTPQPSTSSADAGQASSDNAGNVLRVLPGAAGAELDAGQVVDAGQELDAELADAGQVVDGGHELDADRDVADIVLPDAAELVDAGPDAAAELSGVADAAAVGQYGEGAFNPGDGCLPGFLNCDGQRSNGCELELGCPTPGDAFCQECLGTRRCVCGSAVPGAGCTTRCF